MIVRKIKSDALGRMNGKNLVKQMKIDIKSGLTPAFVAVTLGTTGLCAFDDLYCITEHVRKLEIDTGVKIWIHVDAAYGGPAFWLKEKRHLMKGVKSRFIQCKYVKSWTGRGRFISNVGSKQI